MKKLLMTSATLLAIVPAMALAQANQTVNVSAAIGQYVTTSLHNGNLDLGSVTQNVDKSVASSGATAAQVTVNFNVSSVQFTLPSTATLTRSGGSETIVANLSCATAATQDAGTTTACGAPSGGTYTQTVNYNGTHGSSLAAQTLYIGASIPAANSENARAGNYGTTITVSVVNPTT